MIINTISGFSASSRKNSDTLKGFIEDVIDEIPLSSGIKIINHLSSNKECIRDSLHSLMQEKQSHYNRDKILFIGKSMGGVKTWWMLVKHWKWFKKILEGYNTKITVILIDPHGVCAGDGKIGSYGTWYRKVLKYDERWAEYDNFNINCIYQRNKYPRGAKLSNNMSNERIYNSNHWDVTDINTPSGRQVADLIHEQMKWLEE